MASITYATLRTLINNSGLAAATCEEIIDHAINRINNHGKPLGVSLSNMTGTAGTKTWNGESEEAGAILAVAAAIYNELYKQSGSTNFAVGIGGLQLSSAGSISDRLAKEMAENLRESDIGVG